MLNFQHIFTHPLLAWAKQYGRKDLPWQEPYHPYRVWLSEVMLQQTQVKTVIPYFLRFIQKFPTVQTLAAAQEEEVLALWAGLGYYSRARHLYHTAQQIAQNFNGVFPSDLKTLIQLPGIGESTAAAIISLAFNRPSTILDGNVKRVLSRFFLISGLVNSPQTVKKLWTYAAQCASLEHPRAYTQAIMDLGATCCIPKQPHCYNCPLQSHCGAFLQNRITDFPEKAPPKKLPARESRVFLFHTSDNQIYLEKRPNRGIWGGLWCLPSIEKEYNCSDYFKEMLKSDDSPILHPLMKLKHVFTHFQLQIEAYHLRIKEADLIPSASGKWFKQDNISDIGLPSAMKILVEHWIQADVKEE